MVAQLEKQARPEQGWLLKMDYGTFARRCGWSDEVMRTEQLQKGVEDVIDGLLKEQQCKIRRDVEQYYPL